MSFVVVGRLFCFMKFIVLYRVPGKKNTFSSIMQYLHFKNEITWYISIAYSLLDVQMEAIQAANTKQYIAITLISLIKSVDAK